MTQLLPGPPEHMGAVGIRPKHLLAATLTLFKGGGTYYAHHLWMSLHTFKPFRGACNSKTNFNMNKMQCNNCGCMSVKKNPR